MEGLLDFAGCLVLLLKVSILLMPSTEEILYFEEFLEARGNQQQLDCLGHRTKLDEDKILMISKLTVDQRDTLAWHITERGRLTASNFGSVLRVMSDFITFKVVPRKV